MFALCVPAVALAAITLQRTYDGAVPAGEFGYACAVIGDMDGDGFAEFAIGAPGDATGGADAGRVFIYRGGHPLADEPTWVITGGPGERLGHSLAPARVDDDYLPDLVIGMPGGPGATGRVMVAYGSAVLGERSVRIVEGTTSGGRFGWAVAGMKWRWGPSSARFIVGAPEANDGAGEVHGLTQGDPPPPTRAFVLHGASAGERFGYAVADAGLTRGYVAGEEFLVGAPESSTGATSTGRFGLFWHDAPDDTLPAIERHGTSAGERLGHAVTGGEDTNPNFFEPSDEFVGGAPGAYPIGPTGLGRAAVHSDQIPAFDIQGSAPGSALGSTVRLLATVTGSGLADLAVAEAGAVRVYTGPLQPWAPPAAVLLAEAADGGFGHAISNSGSIDPEIGSHRQFLVGAPDYDGTGRVYLYGDPSPVTGVEAPVSIAKIGLGSPSPNPARAAVSFSVDLPRAMTARIAVYDVAGREVARVHDGMLGPGRSTIEWGARAGAGPGLYFVGLEAGGVRMTKRLAVMR
jgi:hypothetical protein